MQNVFRLGRTVRHFKAAQLGNKFQYRLVKFCYDKNIITPPKGEYPDIKFLKLLPIAYTCSVYSKGEFSFLGHKHRFEKAIDWNIKTNGTLWNIRLNSFDYLNHSQILPDEGKQVIYSFIRDFKKNKTRFDAHCASLRVINAIKFVSRFQINESEINAFLFSQAVYILRNSEVHLKNNHLLENAFALLYAADFFQDNAMHRFAGRMLTKELQNQILDDGAHFELCPMYHLWVVNRLLESVQIFRSSMFTVTALNEQLTKYASKMLGWISQLQFDNGTLPAINDSAAGYGPGVSAVLKLAAELGLKLQVLPMKESGFRKFRNRHFEMLVDINGLTPSEAPGHSHADTFNFVLNVFGDPFVIDTGISTYENSPQRLYERSTMAHNTVVVNNKNQSEVYGSFRAGRRASVHLIQNSGSELKASHNGYAYLGVKHQRTFTFEKDRIIIRDTIESKKPVKCTAYLHIDKKNRLTEKEGSYFSKFVRIDFEHAGKSMLTENHYAPSFGQLLPCHVIQTEFERELVTVIRLV